MSKNLTYENATYFPKGVQTDVGFFLNEALSATPTDSSSFFVYRYNGHLYLWTGTNAYQLDQQSVGGGGGTTDLDGAYSNGQTIVVDSGPMTLTDSTTGALDTFRVTKTGAGSGDLVQLSVNAALTGRAVYIDMDLGIAATGIEIDNGATARTGSDILVTADSTGSHSVIDINASGSGTLLGFDFVGSYAGSPAGSAVSVVFNNASQLDTTAMVVTAGTGSRGVLFDINANGSDAGTTSHIFDIDIGGVLDSNVIDIAFSTTSTGNALNILMDNAVAATAIRITGAGVRTQPFIELIGTQTGSVDMIDLSADGAFTGDVIDMDLTTAVGARGLHLTMAGARTAAVIAADLGGTFSATLGGTLFDINVTQTGASASPLFDIDVTGVYTGNIFDIALGAASTGHVLNIDMNLALAASFLVLDYGAGTRSEDMIQVTFDGDGTAPFWDIDITNTGAGGTSDWFDIDVTGVYTGSIIDINYGAAATGDAIVIVLGSGVDVKAMNITGAGARVDDIFEIGDASTSNSHVFDINMSGAGSGNVLDITYSAANTGDAISIVMANNVAGSAVVITGAGVRTDDFFKIDSSDTGNSHVFDINLSGISSSNVLDVNYSAASTGNAIVLAMNANVGGQAIVVTSAATGVSAEGSAFDVAHTGDLVAGAQLFRISSTGSPSSTSTLLALIQSTGAGTAGATAMTISATGTNVEALDITAGLFFQSVSTATPGAGNGETLSCISNIVFYDPNGASRTGVILSAGLRDGQRVTIVNIADAAESITFAAAGTSRVAFGTSAVIPQNLSQDFTWNAATSLWYQNAVV